MLWQVATMAAFSYPVPTRGGDGLINGIACLYILAAINARVGSL
ncbi:MAG: hypothetical protein ACTS8U_00060 [Arsenophonus sp. ET-DL9-MAG3]